MNPAWRDRAKMILYHVTTEKKAKRYRQSGKILKPVRGFTTLLAAMAWAMKCGRKVIYLIEVPKDSAHKLPDHHNKYGEAWWTEDDVYRFVCEYSAGGNFEPEEGEK